MATTSPASNIAAIGETAGVIWRVLAENGPLSVAKLVKAVDEPRDVVMLGLGWLARESKISIEDAGRNRIVSLQS
jgi:hypothetical protein